jgi:biopolymer transport protein ExbB/TolQ
VSVPDVNTGDVFVKFLMALGAIFTGVAGWALSKRGQRDTAAQQQAANQLQTRVNTVDELEAVITHLKQERDYAETIIDKLRQQNTKDAAAQAARCQIQLDRLIDNVATLQSVVSDEIARAAALDAARSAQDHEATDHGRTWDDDETRY